MVEHARSHDFSGDEIAGRYAVVRLIGRGGMADVYEVRDAQDGRTLALKRLRLERPERAQLAIALFEREYYTLAQLAHPSVIRVYEYGVDDHGAHYTMELLEGSDLLQLGRRPWRQACSILRDIASALAVLHARRWLHRDLSPRNVFLGRDGVAKLIDFGAMAPMGVGRSLVGTPPLVPPEAVQQQALDAQADLYSLGALAYFMLTGRHAFPARSFDDLRDLWRTVVRPPERIAPDIPETLSQLVLELLQLDRFARPSGAAAVIERLDGLLGRDVAPTEREAGRAYLATPKLIARDQELARVRKRMVHSLGGRGAAVLVEGEEGSGRSRFLDACVLEARLLGAIVLRASASDGASDYGVVAELGEQLIAAVPLLAADVARLHRDVLGRALPSLAFEARMAVDAPAGSAIERRHVQTAVRDFFRAIARSRRIVIAVDDLERIDEPSLAVLAALAHKSERRKLVLLATTRSSAPTSPGLELVRDAALRITLPPLAPAHTEALLESLFAQAANAALLAPRIHELAAGNPREVMALAEHLVQRGLARYAAGRWTLPARLDPHDLPPSMEAALTSRLAGLPADAIALAEALALTDPRELQLPDYAALCGGDDHAQAFAGLAALVAAGVLASEGERYRFTHGAWPALLAARLPADRAREWHRRIALALRERLGPMAIAQHLMASGQEREAIASLLARRSETRGPHNDAQLALLERAVETAEQLGLPRRSRLELQIWLLDMSAALGRPAAFARVADDALAALERASGLEALRAIGPDVAPGDALRHALALAQQAHDTAPEHERTFPPVAAIGRLSRVAMSFIEMTSSALDPSLLDRLPSLAPFIALAPQLELIELNALAARHSVIGRFAAAHAAYAQLKTRIDAIDPAAMGPEMHERARLGVTYALGVFDAAHAAPAALERASDLERHIRYRVNAWRIRMVYHAMRGDLDEARRCERRAQLLLLQDGTRPFPATDLHAEAAARYLSDDLEGLRPMLEHLQEASKHYPARAASCRLAECQYLRLKGVPAGALALLEPLLAGMSPEKSERFVWFGATHVMVLNALGRYAEAAGLGRRYMTALQARGLVLSDCAALARPQCEALARSGEPGEGAALAEALIEEFERLGSEGLVLGSCYEARARVAIAAGDGAALEHWIARCRAEYERVNSAALARKLARLHRDAQLTSISGPLGSPGSVPPAGGVGASEPAHATVLSRMADCVDGRERFTCALTLLLEETGATVGHLYGWLSGRLTHLSARPEAPPPAGIDTDLQRFVEAELRASETTAEGGAGQPRSSRFPAPGGDALRPLLLSAERDGEPVVAAVALLRYPPNAVFKPSRPLLTTLALSLLEHDDVDAQVRFG